MKTTATFTRIADLAAYWRNTHPPKAPTKQKESRPVTKPGGKKTIQKVVLKTTAAERIT